MVDGAEVDGFRFGMITDFIGQPDTYGDGYVIAPDNSRAGLIWQSECDPFFDQAAEPDERTWGIWSVGLPLPMRTATDAKEYLRALLPDLRPRWQGWTADRSTPV